MRSYKYRRWPLLLMPIVFPCSLALASPGDQPTVQDLRQGTLRTLTQRLETEHYAPRKIDDVYSADVWNRFLTDLDKDKNIFLASDLAYFQQYKSAIDDEMHSSSTRFFDTVMNVYRRRVNEAIAEYHALLQAPVPFHSDRTIVEDRSAAAWPKDEAERKAIWEDRVRFFVLKKVLELNGNKVASIGKSDLRKAAPTASVKVRKWLDIAYKYNLSSEGEGRLWSIYLNAMTACMDPHSTYFAPVDARTMNEQLSNHYYGLGMELSDKEGEVTIQSLIPGGSADKSGLLKANDKITAVSDKDDHMVDVSDLPVTEVTKMLRGEKGTSVRLQVLRSGEGSRIVTLERAEVNQTDAAARAVVIEKDGRKTGYIYLPMFYVDAQNPMGAHCSADVYKLLLQLKEAKIDALVIDLRDNPGGSLEEVATMAALFIRQGPLVQLKDKNQVAAYNKNDGNAPVYTGPMTVLVNGNSASASEIFAAAMQDYKRAFIIGSRTYGKGTAQENVNMGKVADRVHNRPAMNFGSMRLSFKKIYRVTGSSTQLKGVTPDLLLPDGNEYAYIREANMPLALPWDTVAASAFKPWDTVCDPSILQRAHDLVSRDSAFTIIRQNSEWLQEHHKDAYSLDPEKLGVEIKILNGHLARIAASRSMAPIDGISVQKPPAVNSKPEDKESGKPADKQEDPVKYNRWVEQLKSDIYIREAMNVLGEMISESNKNTKI